MENILVKNIMIASPITVGPEDSVVYAAKILSEHGFNGLPVLNAEGKLIGIITEYDLISKGNDVHLPTLISVLGNIDVYKKDKSLIRDDLKKLLALQVKDVMNSDPLTVGAEAPVQELADLFAHHHRVNPIPVVDGERRLVGIVSRFDLVRLFVDEGAHKEVTVGANEIPDKKIDAFIGDFERRFVFVSKTRAKYLWPILAISFGIIGFLIAFAIILRIAVK